VSENREPVAGHPDANRPETDNPYDTPMWRAIKKGFGGGALIGFVIAKFYIDSQSVETPVGVVYEGNILLVFGVCIGLGAAVGAGIGWLSMQKTGDDDRPPPPDLAREP